MYNDNSGLFATVARDVMGGDYSFVKNLGDLSLYDIVILDKVHQAEKPELLPETQYFDNNVQMQGELSGFTKEDLVANFSKWLDREINIILQKVSKEGLFPIEYINKISIDPYDNDIGITFHREPTVEEIQDYERTLKNISIVNEYKDTIKKEYQKRQKEANDHHNAIIDAQIEVLLKLKR